MLSQRKSRFALHVAKYADGCGSCHCRTATKRCLYRGKVPADILFVGEAPGQSEDSLGVPFIGPAGHLLDGIISRAVPVHLRVGFTNIVACIPLDESGDKFTEPDYEQIKQCQPRLIEIVQIARPQMIVRVGKLSQKWFPVKHWSKPGSVAPFKVTDIVHPAAILRNNVAAQEWMTDQAVATLRTACESLFEQPY